MALLRPQLLRKSTLLLLVVLLYGTGLLYLSLTAARRSTASKPSPPLQAITAHTDFWWINDFGYNWQVPNCSWEGRHVDCHYVSTSTALRNDSAAQDMLRRAQALVHENCWDPASVSKELQHLPQVMYSMEPVTVVGCLDTQKADIEMTYRSCSQVWSPYWSWLSSPLEVTQAYSVDALRSPPKPFKDKLPALIYINSNCAATNERHHIIRQLMARLAASNSSLAVHSFGKCNTNVDQSLLADFQQARPGVERLHKKLDYFRRYKFCVTMENSVTQDYVTEKLYDGLVAGCITIYLGAANMEDFVPDSQGVINYALLGTPERLQAELEQLANNATAYEFRVPEAARIFKASPNVPLVWAGCSCQP